MKKQLRKLLSALLVLTMLLSALPMAAFAEEGKAPAVVTEAIDAHTHEQTEEPAVEPTIELIEAPAVEEAEALSTEPTEAPAVEEADEPTAEPTEAPAVEEVEEPVAEPTEALEDATAVEPEAEPEQEPAPAAEENKDESETEEASEPTENEEDDPLSGLTDEQLAVLKDLPEGFSAEVVAYAMLSSTGCQHIDLDVIDNKEYDYKKIDKEKHFVTIVYTARRLRCNDCGETLQTISYEKTVSGEYGHDWYWCGWDESESSRRKSNYSFRCDNCDERITLDPPCNHESLVDTASEGLICAVCRLGFWPGYDNDAPKCKHSNYTVVYPGEEETFYLEWDYETHLKKKSVTFYFDDDNSWGYDAKCNDCGKWLIYENGKIDDTDYTGRSGVQYRTTSSEFEAHSFVNGVCELCGEEKVEETCQHTNTKRVENTSKRSEERKPFDDAQHEVIVTKYYELYCADCNAYIRDDGTEESTSKEAHDFSNGDICECGYKKTEETCQHTNTKRVENTSKRTTERKPFDDAQHEVIVTKYYELYCADCNAYIRDDGTEESTSKEAHDFGNGDTCECGYKKTETSEDELYVRGFTMSATEITVGDKVSFTLDIANASNGDAMTIEMLADDKFTVTFENVTVRNGSANIQHEFSNEGMRSIKFRVVGGEYCKPQTLKVNPKPTGKSAIHSVVVEPKIDQARVERLGGETFTVTVVCNLDTVCVEMYFGEQKTQDTYRSSQSYTEANGTRTFTMTYTLGEDGKSYAGSYPIVVRPLSKVDAANWEKNVYGEEKNVGKLKVTHDNEVVDRIVKDAYKHTANGHTKIQNITTVLKCRVCGATDKQVANKSVGVEEAHTLDANGRCNVCGYGRRIKDVMYKLEKMKFRDKFKESEYYKKLCEVELTGDIRKDVIEIARSQMKVEGGKNKDTEYGYWIGKNNDEWCASFASWCIYVAAYANDIDPNEVIRKATGASFRWDCFNLSGKKGAYDPPQAFTFRQVKDGYKYKEDETIKVEMGDLVFITWENDGIKERNKFDDDNKLPYHDGKMSVPISHVGIVEKFYSNGDGTYTLMTLEGNTGKKNGGVAKTRSLIIIADGTMIAGGARIGTILYFGKPNYEAGK